MDPVIKNTYGLNKLTCIGYPGKIKIGIRIQIVPDIWIERGESKPLSCCLWS